MQKVYMLLQQIFNFRNFIVNHNNLRMNWNLLSCVLQFAYKRAIIIQQGAKEKL